MWLPAKTFSGRFAPVQAPTTFIFWLRHCLVSLLFAAPIPTLVIFMKFLPLVEFEVIDEWNDPLSPV